MVVEVNSSGFRKPVKEQYPSYELLVEIFEAGIDITFGADAHKVEDVNSGWDRVKKLIKEIGFSRLIYFKERSRCEIYLK